MAGSDRIGGVGGTAFGPGRSPGSFAREPAEPARPATGEARAPLDQVELTEPRRARLELLRGRVLAHTRRRLELGGSRAVPEAAPATLARADGWTALLWSEQHLLAARRRAEWPAARVAQALEDGMVDGFAEALEVLHDAGELDAGCWELVRAVLESLQRKLVGGVG